MSNRSIVIMIVIAILVIGGVLGYRQYLRNAAEPQAVPAPEADAAKDKTRTSVRVHVETCNKSFAKTEMGGYIENTGTVDLHYVTVETIWKNKDGLVVSTDLVYVLNGDTLAPGARKTFSDSSNLPSVARCNANPVDWW